MKTDTLLSPVHPGDILREEFLGPLGLSVSGVAKDLQVKPIEITATCEGTRSITAPLALKLGEYFKISPEIFIGLQAQYDAEVAYRKLSTK